MVLNLAKEDLEFLELYKEGFNLAYKELDSLYGLEEYYNERIKGHFSRLILYTTISISTLSIIARFQWLLDLGWWLIGILGIFYLIIAGFMLYYIFIGYKLRERRFLTPDLILDITYDEKVKDLLIFYNELNGRLTNLSKELIKINLDKAKTAKRIYYLEVIIIIFLIIGLIIVFFS